MILYLKRLFRIGIAVVSFTLVLSSQVGQVVAQPLYFNEAAFTSKTFPLLSAIGNNRRAVSILKKDKILSGLVNARFKRMQDYSSCTKVQCYAELLKWWTQEIIVSGDELIKLYQHKKPVRKLVSQLRRQNAYPLYEKESDTALLRKAWTDAALGMNQIFEVYIKGEKPRYPKIDSISFSPGDSSFKLQLSRLMYDVNKLRNRQLFYEAELIAAMRVLKINGRCEAVNYTPLEAGLNEQPFKKIRSIDFSQYQYSLILIPGLGPEIPGQALAPAAIRRCEAGVARYKKGLAPFIVVSGGNVHPFRTPYNEAVEMKKYIVEELGVPGELVFIEPDARHTTTNIRNTGRMIYRFGLPMNKPVLIVTDSSQAAYIAGRMRSIALRDLGYLPYQDLRLIIENEVEFYPAKLSLHPDPLDPLDP